MCDDLTPQHIDTLLARRGLTRRSFCGAGHGRHAGRMWQHARGGR
ncbi:hypothetical protein ACFSTD_04685 [Novosphingobium colocasiae]